MADIINPELNPTYLEQVSGGANPPEGVHIYTNAELDALCVSAGQVYKPLVSIFRQNNKFVGVGTFQGKNRDAYFYAILNSIVYTTENYCFGEPFSEDFSRYRF